MKIEKVYDQEVRVIRRGPYAYVEINVSPDRDKTGADKGYQWKPVTHSQETPSLAALQRIVQSWEGEPG